jgi:hypothetical protein
MDARNIEPVKSLFVPLLHGRIEGDAGHDSPQEVRTTRELAEKFDPHSRLGAGVAVSEFGHNGHSIVTAWVNPSDRATPAFSLKVGEKRSLWAPCEDPDHTDTLPANAWHNLAKETAPSAVLDAVRASDEIVRRNFFPDTVAPKAVNEPAGAEGKSLRQRLVAWAYRHAPLVPAIF